MEKVKYQNSILFLILVMVLIGCGNKNEKILNNSWAEFERCKADLGLEQLKFTGPVAKGKIENFSLDSKNVIYGWYKIHKKDTFWIYTKVDTLHIKDVGIHFSSNFNNLRENWEEW